MKRSELREHMFLMLFRKDFYPKQEWMTQAVLYLEGINKGFTDEFAYELDEKIKEGLLVPNPKEQDYLRNRFEDYIEKADAIDAMIEEASTGWKLNRIGKVEVTIIRLATYEMKFDEEIPTGVAINEAVELAKKFGEDNSAGFVNGLLAKLTE